MMLFPLLCLTALSLLQANANPAYEGYRYEKPSIMFEYPTVTTKLPKTADIKPTPTTTRTRTPTMNMANEKLNTKSKPNSATVTKATKISTIATVSKPQQQQEKSHAIEKIKKSTVINPTAIKATNLNIKSNKNPVTPPTITITTAEFAATTVTVEKRKTDKLSLNQLSSNSSTTHVAANIGCTVYKSEKQKNLKRNELKKENKTDTNVLDAQKAALENLLNRDKGYIYRLPSRDQQVASLDHNLPHTVHDQHHANKRLKSKNEVYEIDHSIDGGSSSTSIKYCCDKTFDSLREKYRILAKNRPLERRLSPYTEKLVDTDYFK